MTLVDRFDRWVDTGPFTPRDLGIYRIVYAVVMLNFLPSFRWVDAFPDSFLNPPLGPFRLMHQLPPIGVMLAVEIALAVSLAALALGYRTTLASITTTTLLLYGNGVSYSLGKIDHSIFIVLVPAVLAFARWGDAVSVDALRRRSRSGAPLVDRSPQWPLRLLALLIGLGFVTAALPKILSGWLDPRSQAVQQTLGVQYYARDRTELMAPFFVHLDLPIFWEVMDVSAVLIECAVILTVPSWRAFRAALACASLFHLGVLLMMNIPFSGNVLVYAAFIPWGVLIRGRSGAPVKHVGSPRQRRAAGTWASSRWVGPVAAGLAVTGGLVDWWIRQHLSAQPLSRAILVLGAAVSAWYLVRRACAALRWLRRPHRMDLSDPSPPAGLPVVTKTGAAATSTSGRSAER